MRDFVQHLARDIALPILSHGYAQLVADLKQNPALAQAAKMHGMSALLASDDPAISALKKGGKELVTGAEKLAEKAMREAVLARFPEHAIVGEEHGFKPGSSTRWVFDPIDGTSAMIRTAMAEAFDLPLPKPTPAFGITIAVVEGDVATVGLVAGLAAHRSTLRIKNIYLGDGRGTTCNDKDIPLPRYPHTLANAQVACTVPEIMFGKNAEKWGGFQGLLEATGKPCLTDQNCIGFMRLLHDVQVVYEADLAYHDAAALIPILQGAGLIVSDEKGLPILFPESAIGKEFCVLAAPASLHAQAVEAIQKGTAPEKNRYTPTQYIQHGYNTKFSEPS